MNLHGIVRGVITGVNPDILVTIQFSTGHSNEGGRQVPTYQTARNIPAQVQALTFKDLHQLDGLNQAGVQRAIYLYGKIDGVIRSEVAGGDIITIASGANRGTWLVTKSLEQWPDWCKVAVTLQQQPGTGG